MRYLLYGSDEVIRIGHDTGSYRVEALLLRLIEERTGLVPCSLSQPSVRERIFKRFHLPYVEP